MASRECWLNVYFLPLATILRIKYFIIFILIYNVDVVSVHERLHSPVHRSAALCPGAITLDQAASIRRRLSGRVDRGTKQTVVGGNRPRDRRSTTGTCRHHSDMLWRFPFMRAVRQRGDQNERTNDIQHNKKFNTMTLSLAVPAHCLMYMCLICTCILTSEINNNKKNLRRLTSGNNVAQIRDHNTSTIIHVDDADCKQNKHPRWHSDSACIPEQCQSFWHFTLEWPSLTFCTWQNCSNSPAKLNAPEFNIFLSSKSLPHKVAFFIQFTRVQRSQSTASRLAKWTTATTKVRVDIHRDIGYSLSYRRNKRLLRFYEPQRSVKFSETCWFVS